MDNTSQNINAQTKKDIFGSISTSSKRKPNLLESDRGKEFYNNTFQKFLNISTINHYSRNTSIGSVFAELLHHTVRDLLKIPVFEMGESHWVDVLPTITKQ